MPPVLRQPEDTPAKYASAALLLLSTAVFCAGCANPGPAKPPSLHLPEIVKDLQAERAGDHVLLHWTTPSRTTDQMEIVGAMTAEICREVGDRPLTPAARAAACAPVRRFAVAPGTSEVADTLPPALQAGPAALLTYRVRIYNSTGHSAGDSTGAYTAAGIAPPAITSLQVTASEHGAILQWQRPAGQSSSPSDAATAAGYIDLTRTDLSAPKPPQKLAKPVATHPLGKGRPAPSAKPKPDQPDQLHLRTQGDPSGTIDATAALGSTYTYVVERVRLVTIGTRSLEIHSEPSAPVTIAMRDTFPPKTPTGLAAISGFTRPAADAANAGASAVPYIDLSWEPNSEPDLAGYRVYRQLARPDGSPQGPLARLTELPLAAPAYRDVAVQPGQGYIYSVTAVDAAGNESAPSAKALETISPEAGGSAH